jgi:RNA polymerase sigma-70 factor (ECF subfamily)
MVSKHNTAKQNTTMDQPVALADIFQTHRRLLWGLSYRLTGCAADADDIVQETFVRALKHPVPSTDESWRPWLVRVATNLGLDVLRRRRRRAYVGTWLPSPIETEDEALPAEALMAEEFRNPEARYTMIESVSFAFLLALEALGPKQRAALLLRDVCGYSARHTADVLGLSEENVRIIHHRARRVMQQYDRERRVPTRALREQTQQVLAAFVRSLISQDMATLEALLAEGVRTVTDGGGEYNALRAPLVGRSKVAVFHSRITQRRAQGVSLVPRVINGQPAILVKFAQARPGQVQRLVLRCDLDKEGRIQEIHSILASRKLTAVRFD